MIVEKDGECNRKRHVRALDKTIRSLKGNERKLLRYQLLLNDYWRFKNNAVLKLNTDS